MTKLRDGGVLIGIGFVVIFAGMCLLGIGANKSRKEKSEKCEPKVMVIRPKCPTDDKKEISNPSASEETKKEDSSDKKSPWWKVW